MITNPSKRQNSGKCCSGLLQRFLCPGSLQTYPSDNCISELDKIEFNQTKVIPRTEISNQITPGVVARLMGLDSMPDLNWVPQQRTSLDWTMRSRSVGYADYLPDFSLTPKSVHRRVRTSVSFREVPSYLSQSNRDFLVLCFDKDGEIRSSGERVMRKLEVERRRSEKDASERNLVKEKENQENSKKASRKKVNSRRPQNSAVHKMDDYRKPNTNLKESPLKPLNHKERGCLKYNKTGAKEITSRKKLPRKARHTKKPCSNSVHKGKVEDQEVRAIQKKVKKQLVRKLENEFYSKMSVCILRLTEKDTNASKWSFESRNVFKFEDVEVVCAKLGEDIFQSLLDEIVNELVYEEEL